MACFGVPLKQVQFCKFCATPQTHPQNLERFSTYDKNVVFKDRKAKHGKMYDPAKD